LELFMLLRFRRLALAALVAGACAAPAVAAEDPAASRADSFCRALVDAVRQSTSEGAQARARKLQPVVEEAFNTRIMAQFATGAAWDGMSEAERAAVAAALTRYSAARLAQEFDSYKGQSCVVDPAVQSRGVDRLVKSRIVLPGEAPAALNYRLREYPGGWKIIDLYYEGVSQLATERADFAGVLRAGGASALVKRLNELSANLR
jgi:phospholipid transport system substrate-binding protein